MTVSATPQEAMLGYLLRVDRCHNPPFAHVLQMVRACPNPQFGAKGSRRGLKRSHGRSIFLDQFHRLVRQIKHSLSNGLSGKEGKEAGTNTHAKTNGKTNATYTNTSHAKTNAKTNANTCQPSIEHFRCWAFTGNEGRLSYSMACSALSFINVRFPI